MLKITTSAPKANNRSIEVDYEKFYEASDTMSATEALEKNRAVFGDAVVNSVFLDGGVIRLQARIRSWLQQGAVANKKGEVGEKLTDEQIKAKANEFVLGVATVKKSDKVQDFLNAAAKMSPDKLLEVIAQLKAKAAGIAQDASEDENGEEE
jgi:hypothetical protein